MAARTVVGVYLESAPKVAASMFRSSSSDPRARAKGRGLGAETGDMETDAGRVAEARRGVSHSGGILDLLPCSDLGHELHRDVAKGMRPPGLLILEGVIVVAHHHVIRAPHHHIIGIHAGSHRQ